MPLGAKITNPMQLRIGLALPWNCSYVCVYACVYTCRFTHTMYTCRLLMSYVIWATKRYRSVHVRTDAYKQTYAHLCQQVAAIAPEGVL